jgi:hypothetical protein
MALRSLGIPCTQDDVWPEIARASHMGGRRARTQLLARAALERQLDALIVQCRDPWTTLARCLQHDVRVILNHRAPTGAGGHYSVLVALEAAAVVLHDPLLGPERRVDRDELLSSWQAGPEVTGRVLVALARPTPGSACSVCGSALPRTTTCVHCESAVGLQPAAALGCVVADCAGRGWTQVFCPRCDWGMAGLPPAGTADAVKQE